MEYDDAKEDEICQQLKKLGVNVSELQLILSIDEIRDLATRLDKLVLRCPYRHHKPSSSSA
jgi:hypothetical protein